MKPHDVVLAICAVLLCLSIALAGSPGRGQQAERNSPADGKNETYAALRKAPEKARDRVNPLENDPDAVPAGRILFETHCAECHGMNAEGGGKGGKKAPSLQAPEVQNATPGTLFWLLTNGVVRKGMPVWSKLPEPQRWALVRYLKSLGVATPASSDPSGKP